MNAGEPSSLKHDGSHPHLLKDRAWQSWQWSAQQQESRGSCFTSHVILFIGSSQPVKNGQNNGIKTHVPQTMKILKIKLHKLLDSSVQSTHFPDTWLDSATSRQTPSNLFKKVLKLQYALSLATKWPFNVFYYSLCGIIFRIMEHDTAYSHKVLKI